MQNLFRFSSKNGSFPDDMQIQPGSVVAFPRATYPLVTLMCSVGKPKGRGSLVFPSAHPHAVPIIDSQVLGDPVDRARIVEALMLAREMSKTSAMRDLAEPFFPRARTYERPDDLERAIEWVSGSGYHPCGTVPMGEAVDEHGRVDGIERLVLCDASIMPTIPSANTHLTVLMMGERFGEWIRDGLV
jgi:choline dehydrogenase